MKNNKYFYFETPHLKHLLFLAYFFILMIKSFIQHTLEQINNLSVPFFNIYIFVIADSLSIIPEIIIKRSIENNKSTIIINSNINSNRYKSLIYYNKADEQIISNQKKAYRNIIKLASIDYFAQISLVIYYLIKQEYIWDVIYFDYE